MTCGTGFVGRDRDCDNAGPGDCVGPSQEMMSCSPGNCPGIHAKVNKSFKYQSRANPESHILQLLSPLLKSASPKLSASAIIPMILQTLVAEEAIAKFLS